LPNSRSHTQPATRDAPTEHRPDSWAGVALADRRAVRRELLVDAAFDLLGTEGSAGTTVRAVCQRARLNARYFYESFDDLDALAVAVYDRVVLELRRVVIDAIESAPPDPREQLRATIGQIVQFVDDDRRRAKVLYVEALGNEALNRRRIATGHAVVEAVQAYAEDHHGPPPPGEPIGGLAAAILVGGLSELLVSWIDGRLDVSRTQLVDDATALFAALGEAAASTATRRS
jgi:AcrR family transcriptional regulator